MDLWVFITGGLGLLVIAWYLVDRTRQRRQRHIRFSDPVVCAQILACNGYNGTGATNLYSKVMSRAIPNQRLVLAFDIDNSFTTFDEDRRKKFNSEAVKAIKMTETKWRNVALSADKLVREAVSLSKSTPVTQPASITLDSLVRSVCLKIVLEVLFDKNPVEINNERISTITESINNLWIQSKGEGKPSQSEKLTLQEALAKELPELTSPHEKPLNLIIPAYETLWRVVLSGFLQVTFVKGASPTWRSVLAEFLTNPTVAARKEPFHHSEVSTVSVDHIVKEALRLYPSVKRVYRQFHMDNKSGSENVAADIEACQRNEALWGADAQRFVPSRWINASKEAQNSSMAFGVHPFVCPAKGEFGPMMIGILVAALTHHISSEDWHLKLSKDSPDVAQRDFEKALSGEKLLVSDRSTYEGISIVRK